MFMRYISHEIRTPLNIVVLGLGVVNKKLIKLFHNDTSNECIKTIEETQASCAIAVSILNDMLLYDKVESGALKLDILNVSPWSLLKDAVQPFFLQAHAVDVVLMLQMTTPHFNCTIQVDSHKLHQVIGNLVSNALKFTQKPGTVQVEADVVSREQLLEVSDNFQPEELIAEQYFRVRVTDKGAGISKV